MSKYLEEFADEYEAVHIMGEDMADAQGDDVEDEDAFCCDTFFSEFDYVKHKYEEHTVDNMSDECSEDELDNVNSDDEDEDDYLDDECPICEAIFPDMTALVNHCNTAHKLKSDSSEGQDVPVTREVCLQCEATFSDVNALREHGKLFHIEKVAGDIEEHLYSEKFEDAQVSDSEDINNLDCDLDIVDEELSENAQVSDIKDRRKSDCDDIGNITEELSLKQVEGTFKLHPDMDIANANNADNIEEEGEECPDCDLFFTDIISLNAHYKTIHEDDDTEYESDSVESVSLVELDLMKKCIEENDNIDIKIKGFDLLKLNEKNTNYDILVGSDANNVTIKINEDTHENYKKPHLITNAQKILSESDDLKYRTDCEAIVDDQNDVIENLYESDDNISINMIKGQSIGDICVDKNILKLDEDILASTDEDNFELAGENVSTELENKGISVFDDDDSEFKYIKQLNNRNILEMKGKYIHQSMYKEELTELGNSDISELDYDEKVSEYIQESRYEVDGPKTIESDEFILESEEEDGFGSDGEDNFVPSNKRSLRQNKFYFNSEPEEYEYGDLEDEDFGLEDEDVEEEDIGLLYGYKDISVSRNNYRYEDDEYFSESDDEEDFYDSEDEEDSSESEDEDLLDLHIKESNLPLVRRGITLSDGNCWYDATSDQVILHNIPGMPTDHVNLRKAVCKAMLKLPQAAMWKECFFNNSKKKFKKFIAKHGRSGEWTDDQGLMCQATALVLKRNIHIVGTANRGTNVSFTKLEGGEEADSFPPLTVGYYQDLHYQSLQTIDQRDRQMEEEKKRNQAYRMLQVDLKKEDITKMLTNYSLDMQVSKQCKSMDVRLEKQIVNNYLLEKQSSELKEQKQTAQSSELKEQKQTAQLCETMTRKSKIYEEIVENNWLEEDDFIEPMEEQGNSLIDLMDITPYSPNYEDCTTQEIIEKSIICQDIVPAGMSPDDRIERYSKENICDEIINDLIASMEKKVQHSVETRCDNIISEIISSVQNLGKLSVRKKCDEIVNEMVVSILETKSLNTKKGLRKGKAKLRIKSKSGKMANNNNLLSSDEIIDKKSIDIECNEAVEATFTSVEYNIKEIITTFESKDISDEKEYAYKPIENGIFNIIKENETNIEIFDSNIEVDISTPVISYLHYPKSYILNEDSLSITVEQKEDCLFMATDPVDEHLINIVEDKLMDYCNVNDNGFDESVDNCESDDLIIDEKSGDDEVVNTLLGNMSADVCYFDEKSGDEVYVSLAEDIPNASYDLDVKTDDKKVNTFVHDEIVDDCGLGGNGCDDDEKLGDQVINTVVEGMLGDGNVLDEFVNTFVEEKPIVCDLNDEVDIIVNGKSCDNSEFNKNSDSFDLDNLYLENKNKDTSMTDFAEKVNELYDIIESASGDEKSCDNLDLAINKKPGDVEVFEENPSDALDADEKLMNYDPRKSILFQFEQIMQHGLDSRTVSNMLASKNETENFNSDITIKKESEQIVDSDKKSRKNLDSQTGSTKRKSLRGNTNVKSPKSLKLDKIDIDEIKPINTEPPAKDFSSKSKKRKCLRDNENANPSKTPKIWTSQDQAKIPSSMKELKFSNKQKQNDIKSILFGDIIDETSLCVQPEVVTLDDDECDDNDDEIMVESEIVKPVFIKSEIVNPNSIKEEVEILDNSENKKLYNKPVHEYKTRSTSDMLLALFDSKKVDSSIVKPIKNIDSQYCEVCRQQLTNAAYWDKHLKSKKHLNNQKKHGN